MAVAEYANCIVLLVLAPVLEELAFRGFLQPLVQDWAVPRSWDAQAGSISVLTTGLLFATCHLWSHPAIWAMLTFFPSIVLGYMRLRGWSLFQCVALHSGFNLIYLIGASVWVRWPIPDLVGDHLWVLT